MHCEMEILSPLALLTLIAAREDALMLMYLQSAVIRVNDWATITNVYLCLDNCTCGNASFHKK